MINKHYLVD